MNESKEFTIGKLRDLTSNPLASEGQLKAELHVTLSAGA